MQIYIVRTDVDYEVPNVLGYYTQRSYADERIRLLCNQAEEEGDEYPLDVNTLIIEEVTLNEDITPSWM